MDCKKGALKNIQKENAQRITFRQRKDGLKKKISKFNSICVGNETCMIVCDDNGELSVWPEDHSRVHAILENYEHLKSDEDRVEKFDLNDYFNDKKMETEAKIAKVKKEIAMIQYPTWDPRLNELTEEQLSLFIAHLNTKIGACNQKINVLSTKKNMSQESGESSNPSQLNSMMNIACGTSMKRNMSQESGESSNSSQLNSMMNISQGQHDPAPMKLHNDNNGMADSTIQVDVSLDSTNQLGDDVNRDELRLLNSNNYQYDPIFWNSLIEDNYTLQNVQF